MAAAITTLGVGSNLQLQDILDQLRKADETAVLTPRKEKITKLNSQLEEFTVVKNKLLTMKSKALTLSLSSTFLGRTATSSDEKVMTVKAADGAAIRTASMSVTQIASKSTWITSGLEDSDTIVYVPVIQESKIGVTDPGTDVVARAGESITFTYGGTRSFSLNVGSDLTMNDLVSSINNLPANQDGPGANGRYLTAETFVSGGKTFLRIRSDVEGAGGEAHRVTLAESLADLSFEPPPTTFSYKVGETSTTVSVPADTTASEFVALINDDTNNPGATASMVNDGGTNPYRIVLQSNETGEDNRIDMLSVSSFTEQQGADGDSLNAQFSVDGIQYQRQSNTFSDVFSGVTITLVDSGTSTLQLANNNESVQQSVVDLIAAYNESVQELKANTGYDESTEEFGIIADTTLRDLPFDLQSLMTVTVNADSERAVTSLFSMGLEFQRDGTISIDEEILSAAIEEHSEGVEKFFTGDADAGITGFADLINDRLRTITSSVGQIGAEQTGAELRITKLEEDVTRETERLDRKYANLTKQFIELDRFMNQMTSISNYLTGQFNSMTGNDKK